MNRTLRYFNYIRYNPLIAKTIVNEGKKKANTITKRKFTTYNPMPGSGPDFDNILIGMLCSTAFLIMQSCSDKPRPQTF